MDALLLSVVICWNDVTSRLPARGPYPFWFPNFIAHLVVGFTLADHAASLM